MNVNQSIFGYVKDSCQNPEKVKIEYYNRKFTEKEFLSLTLKVCGYLERKGYSGKTVGIMLPNTPEAVFALYGANAAGCPVNLLNPRLKSAALERALKKTDTEILFIYDGIFSEHKEMLNRLGVEAVLCSPLYYRRGAELMYLSMRVPKMGKTYFGKIIRGEEGSPVVGSGKETAVYIHSGGTTGENKTVSISSEALNSLAESVVGTVHEDPSTIPPEGGMLAMLPMFHGFGLGICVHTVINHIRVVLEPLFRAKEAAKLIKRKKISHLAGVPQMYKKLANDRHFKGRQLKNIICVFCGGDRLDLSVKTRFDEVLKKYGSPAEILEGYGLTETASVVTVNPKERVKAGSQGVPLKGNRVKITDAEGRELPCGETGNIELAAVSLMTGYLGDKNEVVTYRDANGVRWLKTGDVGYLDEEGYLYFKERAKRTIKIAAINIFPSEIEAVVEKMPEIKECCAARMTSAGGKPYIKLYVRLADEECSRGALFNKIKAEIKSKIVRYAIPREIVEVKEPLKRTPFAKVDFKYYEEQR